MAGTTSGALPGKTSSGGDDAFVAMYNTSGAAQWTSQLGTSADESAAGVAADATGAYIGGDTAGTFAGQTNSGGKDAFMARYNSTGAASWTHQFGTSGDDHAHGAAGDGTGGYVAGSGGAVGSEAYIWKREAAGGEAWSVNFSTKNDDEVWAVARSGNSVYAAGTTNGAMLSQTSAGGEDAYVHKYDLDGNLIWTRQFVSPVRIAPSRSPPTRRACTSPARRTPPCPTDAEKKPSSASTTRTGTPSG